MANVDLVARNHKFWRTVAKIKKDCPELGARVSAHWHPLYGFDVIKFCEGLGVPDNVSCSAVVRKKFGDIGVGYIEKLIDV